MGIHPGAGPAGGGRSAWWRRLALGAGLLAAWLALPPVAVGSGTARPLPPTAAEVERLTDDFVSGAGAGALEPTASAATGGGLGEEPAPTPGVDALFPDNLVLAVYGAPQLTATAVGKRSPGAAARLLRKQARPYKKRSDRPVVKSINLIGVIATASKGSGGLYRARQDDEVIARYLKAARSVGARLTLDIQPGRAEILDELRALREWVKLPDVDVGIDPEWNVGRRGVPGRDEGSVSFREINRASRWIDKVAAKGGLPAKALIIHQFRQGSIKRRGKLRQRDSVAVTLNFDGIGGRAAKKAGYARLARSGLFDGFSLFYDRDVKLLRPGAVLRLRPEVEYVMYQ